MTKEEYVKQLIRCSGQSIKGFSSSIGIPYTTLLSMLKSGLGGASVDNVIKVCRGLNISVEELQMVGETLHPPKHFYLSDRERTLVLRYREKIELQPAINLLLDLHENP